MKLVFVLVDALKTKYLTEDNMPFLYNLSKENRHVTSVIPSPGFCERCEIFSGLDCFDTGNFTAIGYDPKHSAYANEEIAVSLFNIASKISARGSKFLLRKYRSIKKLEMKPYRIPYNSLKKFTLTEDGNINRIVYSTIFNKLNEAGLKYTLQGFTSLSDRNSHKISSYQNFLKEQLDMGIDFIPIYIGDIDAAGHTYGDDIKSIRPKLLQVDNTLKDLYEISKEQGSAFAVLGDHGMVTVEHYVNIVELLNSLNYKLHEQYEIFLDSTIARFWFYDENVAPAVYELISNNLSELGTIIDANNYIKYRIPLDVKSADGKSLYGDLLWYANPGVLISPDYFNPNEPKDKGMHGYLKTINDDGTGLFVAFGSNISCEKIEQLYLKDICGELCKMLGIKSPNDSDWKRKLLWIK